MKLACHWMKGTGGNPFFSHANIKYADTTAFTNQIIHLISICGNLDTQPQFSSCLFYTMHSGTLEGRWRLKMTFKTTRCRFCLTQCSEYIYR